MWVTCSWRVQSSEDWADSASPESLVLVTSFMMASPPASFLPAAGVPETALAWVAPLECSIWHLIQWTFLP